MADAYNSHSAGLESPAENAAAVTPHDSNELAYYSRALYVGGAGNVCVTLVGSGSSIVFVGVPAGTILPIRCKLVKSTNTTATSIVNLW